jgi:hypothetical protein
MCTTGLRDLYRCSGVEQAYSGQRVVQRYKCTVVVGKRCTGKIQIYRATCEIHGYNVYRIGTGLQG